VEPSQAETVSQYKRLEVDVTEKAEMTTGSYSKRSNPLSPTVLSILRVKDFGDVLVWHGHYVQSARLGWQGCGFVVPSY
jgi:hypothetical protein